MILIEEWRKITGYPGYKVSNLGRIKSCERYVKHPQGGMKIVKERILKTYTRKDGYVTVQLGRKCPSKSIHRLVACEFIENKHNLPCVNHLDGNKSNNRITNLEWCTYSSNEKHSYKVLGKMPNKTALGKFGLDNPGVKPVAEIDSFGEIINVWGSSSIAADCLNILKDGIACACRGERVNGKYKGIRFIYISMDKYKEFEKTQTWGSRYRPQAQERV